MCHKLCRAVTLAVLASRPVACTLCGWNRFCLHSTTRSSIIFSSIGLQSQSTVGICHLFYFLKLRQSIMCMAINFPFIHSSISVGEDRRGLDPRVQPPLPPPKFFLPTPTPFSPYFILWFPRPKFRFFTHAPRPSDSRPRLFFVKSPPTRPDPPNPGPPTPCPAPHIHFRLRCCPCPISWGWKK